MVEMMAMMTLIGHACLARDFPTGPAMTVREDGIGRQTHSMVTMDVVLHLVEEMTEVPSVETAVARHRVVVTHTITMVVVVVVETEVMEMVAADTMVAILTNDPRSSP